MEDLDASGYPERRHNLSSAELRACLSWLAHFHATFMNQKPDGLWDQGTYWHLATRPDELEELTDFKLKNAAHKIDQLLEDAQYTTLVHGDAKVANFCFSSCETRVAAVDFQYVGGGCGMKDVAYLFSSCLDENECERRESQLLDYYFNELTSALAEYQPAINTLEVEKEWRDLYPVAWADFYRFLQGWSPGHWKIHPYSQKLTRKVIDNL